MWEEIIYYCKDCNYVSTVRLKLITIDKAGPKNLVDNSLIPADVTKNKMKTFFSLALDKTEGSAGSQINFISNMNKWLHGQKTTYPFPNINVPNVEDWEWIDNFITHLISM